MWGTLKLSKLISETFAKVLLSNGIIKTRRVKNLMDNKSFSNNYGRVLLLEGCGF